LARAGVLLQLKRYKDAEAELREALAAEPGNARMHMVLSHVLNCQGRHTHALQEAETAIGLAPDYAPPHSYRALALLSLGRADEALQAIQEALRLDAAEPGYYAIASYIHICRRDWQASLVKAEEGLRCNPEHIKCATLRAVSLLETGRQDEAEQMLAALLARDPEMAATHFSQGVALLRRGDAQQALQFFREALRLNPMAGDEAAGFIQIAREKSKAYHLMSRYGNWLRRLPDEENRGFGALIPGVRWLRGKARENPLLFFLLLPLDLVYMVFGAFAGLCFILLAAILRLGFWIKDMVSARKRD
jgi:tetratricopeptide (TPR) repeat protein